MTISNTINLEEAEFYLIAVGSVFGAVHFDKPLQISSGTWLSTESPINLDQFWEADLGRFQVSEFKRSKLFIVGTSPSVNSGAESLAREVALAALYGTILLGIRHGDDGIHISGRKVSGVLNIQAVGRLYDHAHLHGYRPPKFDTDRFENLARSAEGLLALHKSKNKRIRAGFASFNNAFKQEFAEDRLHFMVRSLEAIVKTGPTDIGNIFSKRISLISANEKERIEDWAREIWKLRSKIEHLEDFEPVLTVPKGWTRSDAIIWRALQVELLAANVYLRITVNPDLLAVFADDDKTDAFWLKPESELKTLWGKSFDVFKDAAVHYWSPEAMTSTV